MEGLINTDSVGKDSTTSGKTKGLKTHCNWSDFNYKEPPILSKECIDSLIAIQSEKKNAVELYKALYGKFYKELNLYRETVLANCSNFAFMLNFLNGKYNDKAVEVLNTYTNKTGFFHTDGKFICYYEKSLAIIPKATQSEVFHTFGESDD